MSEFGNNQLSTWRLILAPAVITLAITLLRLAGELQGWSSALFGRDPGGRGSLVGIAWLAPVSGIYFALKLSKVGQQTAGAGKTILYAFLGIVLFMGIGSLGTLLQVPFQSLIGFWMFSSALAIGIQSLAWRELFQTLLAYGLAARIPVIVIMFFAITGNWGTHYDAPPENLPPMNAWSEFVWAGLFPQLTFWIGYTILMGTLFGGIATALVARRKPAG